jgi:hypothetical protein
LILLSFAVFDVPEDFSGLNMTSSHHVHQVKSVSRPWKQFYSKDDFLEAIV